MDERAEILKDLQECIPEFECIKGCTQCCSHVPWSGFEFSLLSREQRQQHSIHTLVCPYVIEGVGCSVHENRPITCRMFAVCEGMNCPQGVPAKQMLDQDTIVTIFSRYQKNFFRR